MSEYELIKFDPAIVLLDGETFSLPEFTVTDEGGRLVGKFDLQLEASGPCTIYSVSLDGETKPRFDTEP